MPSIYAYSLDQYGLDSGGGGTIKTLQRGQSVIVANYDLATATISAVDTTKAILRIQYFSNESAANRAYPLGDISNSTTLNFARTNFGTGSITIWWEVIEFENVKTIQEGTTTDSSGNAVVNINEVNTAKSMIFYSFRSVSTNQSVPIFAARFITKTSISLQGTSVGQCYYNYQVIEFNG